MLNESNVHSVMVVVNQIQGLSDGLSYTAVFNRSVVFATGTQDEEKEADAVCSDSLRSRGLESTANDLTAGVLTNCCKVVGQV